MTRSTAVAFDWKSMGTAPRRVFVVYVGVFVILLASYLVFRTTENSDSRVNMDMAPLPTAFQISQSVSWYSSPSDATSTVAVEPKDQQSTEVLKFVVKTLCQNWGVLYIKNFSLSNT